MAYFFAVVLICLASTAIATQEKFGNGSSQMSDAEWYPLKNLKDWGHFNYSSYEARSSFVRSNGKIYDPLSFKGGKNDDYSIAFHLSTEVAVSAAQSRNGTLFNVAKVDGDQEYRALMSQIHQDLKGNRSLYYAEPNLDCGANLPFWQAYPAYFHRLRHFYHHGPPEPPSPNPLPIFKKVLQSLQIATEEALGLKLNATEGLIKVDVSGPFELNHTYSRYMGHALGALNMSRDYGYYSHSIRPWAVWHDHANDERDYSGDEGTALAFEQARVGAEMMDFDPDYRYGDFICGNGLWEDEARVVEEMKANGTWVEPPEPPRKAVLEWRCRSWGMCLKAKPWKWGFYDVDRSEL